uniref:Uncharacterized protein n=1 Tax=Globodera rostochiensis TaxID=31243 RepID=A0A914HLA6_GLORO
MERIKEQEHSSVLKGTLALIAMDKSKLDSETQKEEKECSAQFPKSIAPGSEWWFDLFFSFAVRLLSLVIS